MELIIKSDYCVFENKIVNLLGSTSFRYSHTDIKIPDFTEYRTSLTENPNQSNKETADERQTYSYLSTFGILIYETKFMNLNNFHKT